MLAGGADNIPFCVKIPLIGRVFRVSYGYDVPAGTKVKWTWDEAGRGRGM